jgi:uncharacterized protein (DUF2147 family)
MKRTVFALAAVAAMGFAGAAFAGDSTTGTWTTSATTAPAVMSDSDMDKVTAGVGTPNLGQSGEQSVYGQATRANALDGGVGKPGAGGNCPSC